MYSFNPIESNYRNGPEGHKMYLVQCIHVHYNYNVYRDPMVH